MKTANFWVTAVVVYIVYMALGFLIHGYLLAESYAALGEGIIRPEEDTKYAIFFITGAFFSTMFVYVFGRGYEGRGLMEGVRYGFVIGLFFVIPTAYDAYAVHPLPYSMVLYTVLAGFVTTIACGIAAAIIYKPASAGAAV